VNAARQRIWFLDTSSLLSLAVDEDIEAAVQDELTRRAGIPETAGLAKIALTCIKPHWSVMDTTRYVSLDDVQQAQEDVADGRTLLDDEQHWAESTIIALVRRSATALLTSIKILLSEDYEARRVACTVPHTRGVSIHSLLHQRVQGNRMTAAQQLHLAKSSVKLDAAQPSLTATSRTPPAAALDASEDHDTPSRGNNLISIPGALTWRYIGSLTTL